MQKDETKKLVPANKLRRIWLHLAEKKTIQLRKEPVYIDLPEAAKENIWIDLPQEQK